MGGKRDKTDRSSYEVATRGAFEEVGLLRQDSTLIGFLPMQISKKVFWYALWLPVLHLQ